MVSLLLAMTCALQISENLTIYPFVPPEANQGWKLELFELAESIEPHYHKLQRQILLMADGELTAFCAGEEPALLRSGDLICIDPGVVHSLVPKGTVRFFSIDLPGFSFPEDVFYDRPVAISSWIPPKMQRLPPIDPKYFGLAIDLGNYKAHELVTGRMTGEKWSLALLEIQNSPKHFHQIEKEIFLVVAGKLDIEVEGVHQILEIGESIFVLPNQVHQLKAFGETPTRVICFNFPAFDPSDMHFVD